MDLISGIPEDVARDCLIRLPYHHFPTVASVCKAWGAQIHSPEFHRQRKTANHAQKILLTVQSKIQTQITKTGLLAKSASNPVYRLSILEPKSGSWSELGLGEELGSGLPMFCQIACVGHDLVVIGGWDPESWKASNSVFVYNFLSAKWRRGTDMPAGPRTFFACASDQDRTVYVAGGHDDEKNALRSALAYDVPRDAWEMLPDMARERDECKAVWGPVEEEFLDEAACPRTCVDGGAVMYMCRGGDVVGLDGDTWRKIAKVPRELRNVACVGVLDGAPHVGFFLDLKSGAWANLVSPEEFTGHVQSGCLMEI
uniref:F-box/kelch-repeat protein At1g80440 family n=1 Tax=Cajanus cajan TaxID=3821 RepID=A0A151R211_CAJCA|nr:F-box/kelch-repeat protein At1g80440 family [Cajanus cajan]